MDLCVSSTSKRTKNRRKRNDHKSQQTVYIDSIPDVENSISSMEISSDPQSEDDLINLHEFESDEYQDVNSCNGSSGTDDSCQDESDAFDYSTEKKVFLEVTILGMLSRCRLTLSAAETVVNMFNSVQTRFSSDPVIFPSVRYLWDKRAKNNPIQVYILCPYNHSHGPFDGEPSTYGSFLCEMAGELSAEIRNDKYFLHIKVKEQLESFLPSIPDSQWIRCLDSITDISSAKIAKKIRALGLVDKRYTFTLHADEVQAGNSSTCKIFPIFLSINELKPEFRRKNFLLVGLFVGKVKPDVSSYLGPICEELKTLEETPISWTSVSGNEMKATFHLIAIVADAPMRAFLRGAKQYNSKHGCDWCLTEADSSSVGARVYANESSTRNSLQRTKNDFLAFERYNNHGIGNISSEQLSRFSGIVGGSPLLQLNSLDIVNGVAVEHMHCMILGIFRGLILKGWMGKTPVKILEPKISNKRFREELSIRMKKIRVTSEITRPPRDFEYIKYWKSSEYDSFLCYYLPTMMKGLLTTEAINNIFCFVRIFQLSHCGPVNQEVVAELKNLIYEFQCGVLKLYGTSFMTYNLHILSHLPESVVFLGPTKNISSYPLENYMGLLKEKVHRTSNIAPSLVRTFMNDFKYQQVLNSISKIQLNDREKRNFGLSDENGEEKITTILEKDSVFDKTEIYRGIEEKTIEGDYEHSLLFYKTVNINGKRFSTVKYGEGKQRCDSIVKDSDGNFMEIQYIFRLQSKITALCETFDVLPVKISFKGITGKFIFSLPHLYEIKKSKQKQILIQLSDRISKCFKIQSTSFHFKYKRDFLVDPFIVNH